MTTATATRSAASGPAAERGLNIVGIDPSLTGTGIAVIRTGRGGGWVAATETITTKLRGHERLNAILSRIHQVVIEAGHWGAADLVVIEGPSYGSTGSSYHQIAGLWWLIAHELWVAGVPYAVATPSARMKYATGKGNAAKDQVLAAVIRRFGDVAEVDDNNQADALVMALMGVHHHCGVPLIEVPALHAEALAKTAWPEVRS